MPGTAHNGYAAVSDRFPKAYTYTYYIYIIIVHCNQA